MAIFNNAVYTAFQWIFNNITHNYFLTIILATLVLKLVTLPFDLKQRKESRKMSEIQPELQKLQKRYANDPQKLQKKQAELYRERGVNMYASCLPLLLTWPIFIMFFGGLRLLANEMSINIALEVAGGNVAYLDQFKFLWINNIFQPDSGMAPVVMSLSNFTNLVEKQIGTLFMLSPEVVAQAQALLPNYETLVLQPANAHVLANAPSFLQSVAGSGNLTNGWFILPLLAGAAAFLQNRLMTKSQPQAGAAAGTGKMMTYVLIGMSVFFCATSNCIFAVYWIVNNLFSIGMYLVMNKLYPPQTDQSGVLEGKGTVK